MTASEHALVDDIVLLPICIDINFAATVIGIILVHRQQPEAAVPALLFELLGKSEDRRGQLLQPVGCTVGTDPRHRLINIAAASLLMAAPQMKD